MCSPATLLRRALLPLVLVPGLASAAAPEVTVEILEGVADKKSWDFTPPKPADCFAVPAFGLVGVPKKFSDKGLVLDRSNPVVLRATCTVELPAGEYRFLLRSRGAARLFVGGRLVAETPFLKANADGHERVPEAAPPVDPEVFPLPVGHVERAAPARLDAGPHEVRLEAFVGGQKLRPELGVLAVGVARGDGPFRLLGPSPGPGLTDGEWEQYAAAGLARLRERDAAARTAAGAGEAKYWQARHEIARGVWRDRPAAAVPEVSARLPVHNAVDRFVGRRLEEKGVAPAPLTDDGAFLRRVTLDTAGVIPTPDEIEAFRKDAAPDRRARVIDRLLGDPRWADHWVGYWQDVLAENPGILKPTLNNTGPFRWWLHQAFLDNAPADRFVTELVRMEGSVLGGGPGGFSLATQNDAPMAAKGHILAKAFLGVEMQCARCHDAPFHPFKQEDLFRLAAMLGKGPQTLPATSTVPRIEGARPPRVQLTLKPGDRIAPAWPFEELATAELPPGVLRDDKDPRERLAAVLTSPLNERFAQVMVNRLWKRYLGWGLVEPVDDWLAQKPSHPELLQYLARELATHDYDLKHVARLILNSHAYQREARPDGSRPSGPDDRLFAAPARRRLSAEQLGDSLFVAAGKEFRSEELTMDPEARRPASEMINLGTPRRAWEFTSLSNERDRPALALPVAQSVVDVMTTFGWRDSRQNPLTVRDETPTPLQPLLLANGVVGSRVTRLSDDAAVTSLCLQDQPPEALVDKVFLRVLSRRPSAEERALFAELLRDGYERRRDAVPHTTLRRAGRTTAVSWANHLSPEATRIKLELERAARAGDPPTELLNPRWRERAEDMLWALVNSPEFVFIP